MIVKKALIIDSPWIEKILEGSKVWEMRSTRTSHRGPFGLIQKGSGKVVGIASLHGVSGPYNNGELQQYQKLHHVPPELYERQDYKWRFAWELSDAANLPFPVKYRHKNGAVTWVDLEDAVVQEIARQFSGDTLASPEVEPPSVQSRSTTADPANDNLKVPMARDGSVFTRNLSRGGIYTVGEKGSEQKFRNFYDALSYLRSMPTAKWRRPNKNGNWGIVSAVDWVALANHEVNQ